MKTYSVYLSYLTNTKGRYRLRSISFNDILANDIISAGDIAKARANAQIKNNINPIEVSMIWANFPQ
jgi:hypothetical protein